MSAKRYVPEIGQFVFGQGHQRLEANDYLITALEAIQDTFHGLSHGEVDPFGNTGDRYKNDVFQAEAYSWDESYEQPFNFNWRDVYVSWYKYLGRGTSVNRPVSHKECKRMVQECVDSLVRDYERTTSN